MCEENRQKGLCNKTMERESVQMCREKEREGEERRWRERERENNNMSYPGGSHSELKEKVDF